MNFNTEKMDVNLRGKVILINRCQVMEEHIRRLETQLIEVKGHDTVETIRNILDPLYKAAEIPRWEKVSVGKGPIQNPLLIEEIVKCIMKNLDYKTQRTLRQVHSCWDNAIMTTEFLQKTVLKIGSSWETMKLIEAFPIAYPNFADFSGSVIIYDLSRIYNQQPFTKWIETYGSMITNLTIGEHIPDANIFEQLLTGLLPNLTHLRLPNTFSTQTIFNKKKPTLQKLQSLEISGIFNGSTNIWCTPSETVYKILNSTVNLKVLKLHVSTPYMHLPSCNQPLEYLKTCCDVGTLVSLIELDLFDFEWTIGSIEFLSQAPFSNLKRLVLPKLPNTLVNFNVNPIFENVKNTLEFLHVDAIFLQFLPEMKKLKELNSDWNWYGGRSINANNFILKLPKLEKLVVEDNMSSINHQLFKVLFSPIHPNNTIKYIEMINVIVDSRRFLRLMDMFNSLEILKLGRRKFLNNPKDIFYPPVNLELKGRRIKIIDNSYNVQD